MNAQKLYMAVWEDNGEEYIECEHDSIACECFEPEAEPEGWAEYARENWPDGPAPGEHWPNGYKPFFWPKTNVPYKSRSAAQSRVDIINRWGGRAVLVECTPEWVPVAEMNRRRERARLKARIDKKRAELAKLEDDFADGITLTDVQASFSSPLMDSIAAIERELGLS